MRGIDKKNGCLVVVRPDQYIAQVLPLIDTATLTNFFAKFMKKI
jgi:phenol 2-monooxygenase (NADPH)